MKKSLAVVIMLIWLVLMVITNITNTSGNVKVQYKLVSYTIMKFLCIQKTCGLAGKVLDYISNNANDIVNNHE